MAIYYVSLVLTAPPNFDEQAIVRLLREAISLAAGVALEVTPTGLLVEADPIVIETLEAALRQALEERGGALNNITFAPR
jgi:hypothetical protein